MTEITLNIGGESSEAVTVYAEWIDRNGIKSIVPVTLEPTKDEIVVTVNNRTMCAITSNGRMSLA